MTVWIIARAVGFAALLLLTAAVAVGAVSSAGERRGGHRLVGQYLHRWLAASGLIALAAHVGAVLADSFAHVGALGALVPFAAHYRPLAVGLGTAAVYTTVVVAITGWARGRLARHAGGARTWRAVHLLSYAGWAMAMLHGLAAGSDSSTPWARAIYLACLGSVAGAVAVRVASLFVPPLLRRGGSPAAALPARVASGGPR